MLQTDRGSQDDQLEWLQKLRARDMDALVKENVNLRGELQRLRAQMPQIKILEEKVERHEGLEQQLQLRVEELQAQLDQCEKSQEQAQQQVQGLQEQLMSAKEKEVELEHARERARKAEEDRNALNLKILDLTGAKEEAKGQLIRSDKVCSELLEKIKERNAAVELMKLESKELQAAERSRIESHQQKVQELNAEITKLNMECQQLRQQEGESCKAKEVMEERLKGKDHQLQSQEVELQRGVRAVEDAKVEGERRWAKSQDEVKSLQEKLDEKVRLEHQLKEKVCILESQVQQHLAEASRLRQDVLRLQTLADERGLTVEKVQKREDNSSEKASEMQKRLQETQSALLTERGKLQETEVELYRARESLSSARKEADEVKRTEEAARREAIRRSDEKLAQELSHTQQLLANRVSRAEEQVAERDAEILRLDRELTQCRGYLAQREREASQLAMELKGASSREGALEHELEQVSKRVKATEASWHQARRQLQGMSPDRGSRAYRGPRGEDWGALTEPPNRLRLGRQAPIDSPGDPSRVAPRLPRFDKRTEPRSSSAEPMAEPLTEPLAMRIHRTLLPQEPESSASELERTWHPEAPGAPVGEEMEEPLRRGDFAEPQEDLDLRLRALRAEVEPLAPEVQEKVKTREEELPLELEAQMELWLMHRLKRLEQRQLLLEVWHSWSATAKVSALRARLELVLLDELRLAKVREEAKFDVNSYLSEQLRSSSHWPEGSGPAQSDPPMEGFENKLASLKSFIFEFRQRVAESVSELPGAAQAAHGLEGSQALVKTLELGRGAFGRLLHAALFLYQKLRTLVPTELEVTMRDPLSRLVPVPFYVLPYKVPPKVRLAVQEVGAQRSVGGLARSLARGGPGQGRGQLEELQDLMPLCASDRTAIPGFLAQLLRIRGAGPPSEPMEGEPRRGAGYRDGLDQLVVDALTVYMSGWRLSRAAVPAVPAVPAEPVSVEAAPKRSSEPLQRREASEGRERRARGPQGEAWQGMKLRLGPERPGA